MADEHDQVESVDDDLAVPEDPDGHRVEGATERPEHLAEDPTPPPAEEAPSHVESQ